MMTPHQNAHDAETITTTYSKHTNAVNVTKSTSNTPQTPIVTAQKTTILVLLKKYTYTNAETAKAYTSTTPNPQTAITVS